jgi:Flp pilus assembly protein TadB
VLIVLAAAGAVVFRVPVAIVAAVLAFSLLPIQVAVVGVLILGGLSIARERRHRDRGHLGEGELLRQISGRVTAGSTIRATIADPSIEAIPDQARRLAMLGQPMADVGGALSRSLPINGAAFRAICSFSEHTGAAIASALTLLAERADEAAEEARQRRISLAQVKFSSVVVGLVPIAVSLVLVVFRGIPEPGGPVIVVPMVLGIGLQLLGTSVVFRVASRAT